MLCCCVFDLNRLQRESCRQKNEKRCNLLWRPSTEVVYRYTDCLSSTLGQGQIRKCPLHNSNRETRREPVPSSSQLHERYISYDKALASKQTLKTILRYKTKTNPKSTHRRTYLGIFTGQCMINPLPWTEIDLIGIICHEPTENNPRLVIRTMAINITKVCEKDHSRSSTFVLVHFL